MEVRSRFVAPTAVTEDRVPALADWSQPEPTTTRQSGRTSWALGRRQWLLLLMSYVGFVVIGTGIGLVLKGPLDDTAVVRTDRSVANWFVDHRTPNLNRYTVWGSDLADTFIKIGATAVLALVLWLLWRRWLEPLMLVVPLVLEASAFITITWLVQRPRPDVDRLEGSPVGSSFPSGHVAAATAYAALAVIVFLHTRNRWARISVISLCAAITAVVGLSRMYRGMHFLSDVVAGVLLGAASVAITAAILLHTPQGRAVARVGDTEKVAAEAEGGA
jgi:membrane-associated phospholipid phosphatase